MLLVELKWPSIQLFSCCLGCVHVCMCACVCVCKEGRIREGGGFIFHLHKKESQQWKLHNFNSHLLTKIAAVFHLFVFIYSSKPIKYNKYRRPKSLKTAALIEENECVWMNFFPSFFRKSFTNPTPGNPCKKAEWILTYLLAHFPWQSKISLLRQTSIVHSVHIIAPHPIWVWKILVLNEMKTIGSMLDSLYKTYWKVICNTAQHRNSEWHIFCTYLWTLH